jgi:PIN domain nuclease of toxin-antitoxin system
MKPTAVHAWLLDTHAMLWMLYDDKRLPASARRLINGDLPVYYSTVSFWEIALKRGGKGFDFEIEDDWDILLPRRMEDLPLHHRDPFDRMIIAQAMQRRFGIISRDLILDRYDILRGW